MNRPEKKSKPEAGHVPCVVSLKTANLNVTPFINQVLYSGKK